MNLFRLTLVVLSAATALTSCTSLPASGPDSRAVEAQAAIKVSDTRSSGRRMAPGVDYALVDLSAAVIANVAQATTPSLQGSFGGRGGGGGSPSLPLGIGDVVSVTIFESQSGGLFIPADAGSRAGNFVTIPNQTVDRNGTITVPYAGRVRASGRSVDEVQQQIQELLSNRAIEPQVVITKVSSRSAQVAVLGDVNLPNKIELTEAGDRVLDVISQAGGLKTPGIETYVTMQRRGRTATVLYDHLINTPSENIFVSPGDTIIVNRERRTYLAFGASGENGRFDFEDSNLTLGEALGKAGGLLDGRADPAQVLLYRVVNREFLRGLNVDVSRYKSETIPVIFRANLRDPSTMFLVQKFPMQDKDIIFVTNSKSTEVLKFLDILNSVTSSASGVSSDVISTRDSVKDL
ncbi:polysaccharide biosynthesis/export family protein [Rhizobium sp. CC-YZS058]|uniref:polysaccharide biosynthesis/export family protein n=1 Tax=Rhizobium sp. CC-YZS058 TaxID=3042153 RepID=UPI002B05EC22|nr:polysaccharide biosynthesis/export family protein [Rhizobium sp. CC-YZS058]